MGDLLDMSVFKEKLQRNLSEINYFLAKLYNAEQLDVEQIYSDYLKYADQIRDMISDSSLMINQALDEGKQVLFEGAQGTHLDIDHGTYPFVTSSSTVAGGACSGTGVGPTKITGVMGVVKVYTTRVGGGPFPTELKDASGKMLQERGHEFGATTGRPRRCGWFDAVAVRYSVRVNGISGLAVTKLDVFDEYATMMICTGYRYQGQVITEMPMELARLSECEPIYEEMVGWNQPTTGIKNAEDLPEAARAYLQKIEELVGAKVIIISTGTRRSETITVEDPYQFQ